MLGLAVQVVAGGDFTFGGNLKSEVCLAFWFVLDAIRRGRKFLWCRELWLSGQAVLALESRLRKQLCLLEIQHYLSFAMSDGK